MRFGSPREVRPLLGSVFLNLSSLSLLRLLSTSSFKRSLFLIFLAMKLLGDLTILKLVIVFYSALEIGGESNFFATLS